jgi:hypothetical protein
MRVARPATGRWTTVDGVISREAAAHAPPIPAGGCAKELASILLWPRRRFGNVLMKDTMHARSVSLSKSPTRPTLWSLTTPATREGASPRPHPSISTFG